MFTKMCSLGLIPLHTIEDALEILLDIWLFNRIYWLFYENLDEREVS